MTLNFTIKDKKTKKHGGIFRRAPLGAGMEVGPLIQIGGRTFRDNFSIDFTDDTENIIDPRLGVGIGIIFSYCTHD